MKGFNIPMTIANGRDKAESDLYEANNRINDLLDIVKQKDEAIKILLTAFEKEKEKNKKLEHQQQVEIEGRKILVNLNENLKEELNKEKEKNKELYEDNQKQWAERCKLAIELDNNTVSKDKIRERIRELKIIRDENADEIKRNMRFYSIYDSYNLQINELHDLLLEEE